MPQGGPVNQIVDGKGEAVTGRQLGKAIVLGQVVLKKGSAAALELHLPCLRYRGPNQAPRQDTLLGIREHGAPRGIQAPCSPLPPTRSSCWRRAGSKSNPTRILPS